MCPIKDFGQTPPLKWLLQNGADMSNYQKTGPYIPTQEDQKCVVVSNTGGKRTSKKPLMEKCLDMM